MLWNIEGARTILEKDADNNFFGGCDIVMLTETFVTEMRFDGKSYPHGYRVFQTFATQSARGRPKSGIAVLVKPHLQPTMLTKSAYHVSVNTHNATVLCFYFPPTHDPDDRLLRSHAEISNAFGIRRHIIVAGDFNCRVDEFGGAGDNLINSMAARGLALVNNREETTYVSPNGRSVIDLIFTTAVKARQPVIIPTAARKHQRVTAQLLIRTARPPEKPQRLKRELDVDKLRNHQAQHDFNRGLQTRNISVTADAIARAIVDSSKEISNYQGSHKPWFDRELRELKATTLALLAEHRRDPQERRTAEQYWQHRRRYKEQQNVKRRQYQNNRLTERIRNAEVTVWTLFKHDRTQIPPPITTEQWSDHFSRLYDPTGQPPQLPFRDTPVDDNEAWFNQLFTHDEVTRTISNTANHKAPGPDRLSNEHIKISATVILTSWVALFNLCLTTTQIPEQWKTSTVKAIYKSKGRLDDPVNYRGIALLDCPFKCLTALLNTRLTRNIGHLLPDEQHGFRQGRNTKTPMKDLVMAAHAAIAQPRGSLYALFVDLKQAFDHVDRCLLLDKLHDQFGVRGRTLLLIRNILSENSIRVDDGLELMLPITQRKGVLQGDSLSPTLFNCYIADLAAQLRQTTATFRFYADDLVIWSTEALHIRHSLRLLSDWCNENLICVNTTKTMIVKFRKGGRLANTDQFVYEQTRLAMTPSYTYLGITLQCSLSFQQHVAIKKAAGIAAVGSIREWQRLSVQAALQIYHMKILPLVSYGLDIAAKYLTANQMKQLDMVKSALLKRVLCLHRSSSSTLAHELCRTPTLSQDLKNLGFEFSDNAWQSYATFREERGFNFAEECFTDGPAFSSDEWQQSDFRNRHVITRATSHGFHHLYCNSPGYHKPSNNCLCQLCLRPANNRYHFTTCAFILRYPMNLTTFIYTYS
jgi:hypothetical protein